MLLLLARYPPGHKYRSVHNVLHDVVQIDSEPVEGLTLLVKPPGQETLRIGAGVDEEYELFQLRERDSAELRLRDGRPLGTEGAEIRCVFQGSPHFSPARSDLPRPMFVSSALMVASSAHIVAPLAAIQIIVLPA